MIRENDLNFVKLLEKFKFLPICNKRVSIGIFIICNINAFLVLFLSKFMLKCLEDRYVYQKMYNLGVSDECFG